MDADAIRHAYWNALMARDIGSEEAKKFGDAHEEDESGAKEEKRMDLYNNAVGRKIGEANPEATNEELLKMIIDALDNGELQKQETRPIGDDVKSQFYPKYEFIGPTDIIITIPDGSTTIISAPSSSMFEGERK